MASHFPVARGPDAIGSTIAQSDSTVKFNGDLTILDIRDIAPGWVVVEIEGKGVGKIAKKGMEVDGRDRKSVV